MRALADGAFHVIPGNSYATPKELWGFRSERGTGTPRGRHARTLHRIFRRRGIGPVE